MRLEDIPAFILFVILLLAFGPAEADGFRCGTKLVKIGDTKAEVLSKCGEPDHIEVWEVERVKKYYDRPELPHRPHRKPYASKVHVTVEEWLYNLGRHKFMRFLRFENGRLKHIEIGDRGF